MKGTQIPQMVKRYIDHDMIQAHTELPAMAHSRVALMYAFLNRNRANSEHSELISIVTSLVQLALDTHDMVELAGSEGDDRNLRSRQLKVLAGDFFSSRFYHLLAQAGQVDAIRALSRGVCEVNRLKMTLLMKTKQWKLSAESYLQERTNLRQCIFHSFDDRMLPQDASQWEELLQQVSYVEVLEQEYERVNHFQTFEGSWPYWYIVQHGTQDERQLLIKKRYDQADWKQLLSKYHIVQELSDMVHRAQLALEEQLGSLSQDMVTDLGLVVHSAQPNSWIRSFTGAPMQG
ncbi:heptaprenyl diphosphate synthase component 1 [Paenibacillus marinisediminis]